MVMSPRILVMSSCLILAVSAAQAAPPAAKDPAQKRRAFAKLRDILKAEPTAKEVQTAALKYYKLDPERIASLNTAAHVKALFPEIDVGIDSTLGHNYSNTNDGLFPTLAYKERVAGSSDQLVWHARGVWALDRLIFNPEQLDIKSLNSLEETLVREVTTMFFSRRRLLASLVLSPPADEEELYYEQLRIDEMTSTLDAFTGGMFGAKAWKGTLSDSLQ